MSIPDFDLDDLLPVFIREDVNARSPYATDMQELVDKFAVSPERIDILYKFGEYRDILRKIGFIEGFQLINGSFVENCDNEKGPPRDIDIVNLLRRPSEYKNKTDWLTFVEKHKSTYFDKEYCKTHYFCDSHFIDLDYLPIDNARRIFYFFGLFSYQRRTNRPKGLLQIDIQDKNDHIAMQQLDRIRAK